MSTKLVTCEAIRAYHPCYDPSRYLPADYSAPVWEFLARVDIPPQDRVWVARHLVSDRTNRLFSVWCARLALSFTPNPDPRSVAACDVAERFARGEATEAELSAARSAAYSAAWSAAWSAAYSAAWSAAESAESAESAASAASAAYSAAWSAAKSAASAASAAYSAAESAESAESAASAASAAYSAAWSAAREGQCKVLAKMAERDSK